MKTCKKLIALLLSGIMMATFLAGCNKSNGGSSGAGGTGTDYDLYIYNSKGENAEKFSALCKEYENETGKRIKVFSIGSGQDHMSTLRSEMNSKNKPGIFAIQGLKELQEWQEGGFVVNFSDLPDSKFKAMAEAIPESMRLTSDGKNNFGIPYNVEGYGYIVDTQMIADLFGADHQDDIIGELITCSYDDFTTFCTAVDQYITSPSAAKVTLNGNSYSFQAEKTGLAKNLTGVFAVMGAEDWTFGDHFINVAMNAVFDTPAAAANADSAKLDTLKEPFIAYAKALDFKTSHVAGQNGKVTRGADLVSPSNFGYDQTVAIFAQSKALFFKQGNWAYGNIQTANPEVAKRLTFIPVKMPFTKEMITVENQTVEHLNSSIPVYVPNFYAINAKVSDAEQQEAQDFLVWLNSSNTGKKYITDEFNFIPYNADSSTTELSDPLGNSILYYIKANNTLAAPYHGAPASWSSDVVGLKIMEDYLTKPTWTNDDYNAIAQFAIDKWKELKGLK